MLDYQTYRIMHPDAEIFIYSRPENAYEYDNEPESISNDTELTDEQKMLCPPNIHGYLLKGKTWGMDTIPFSVAMLDNADDTSQSFGRECVSSDVEQRCFQAAGASTRYKRRCGGTYQSSCKCGLETGRPSIGKKAGSDCWERTRLDHALTWKSWNW
jgi:hypothetical protein